MSKKPAVPKQYDRAFATRVSNLLDGATDGLSSRLADAIACAALSVLAKPEVHKNLVNRIRLLMGSELAESCLKQLAQDLGMARTLLYEEDPNGETVHFLTISEAARRLAVTRNTVYRWLLSPEYAIAPVLEDPDLGPDRVSFETFSRMKREVAEKHEADRLRRELLEDLSAYEKRCLSDIEIRLAGEQLFVVNEVIRIAEKLDIGVSRSTIGRWPNKKRVPARRGRPLLAFEASTVSCQLAAISRHIRRRELEKASLPTLRRFARERQRAVKSQPRLADLT